MVAAVVTSVIFLISYLVYHFYAGRTVFQDPQWFRPIYLVILLTHTVLAVAVVPLVLMTFWRAFKSEFDLHRKIARWTWPIWMYVSVTGVVVYLLLYQIFPQTKDPEFNVRGYGEGGGTMLDYDDSPRPLRVSRTWAAFS